MRVNIGVPLAQEPARRVLWRVRTGAPLPTMSMFTASMALLAYAAPARAEDWAPGATIPEAATVDITPEGFDAIAALIPALIPSNIEIPETGAEGGYWCFNYMYDLAGAWVGVQVTSATIVPGNGVLDVDADMLVNVNDATDPFILAYEILCSSSDCGGYVTAFPVHIHTTMALDVVTASDGSTSLDATVGALDVTYELTNDNIVLDCWIQDIEDVLGYFGLSLYDLLIGQIDSTLQSTISDLGPTLETTIEDAFASANIEQDLDLNGVSAHIHLYPSDVTIQPEGVRLAMAGSVSADSATCTAAYDTGGSLKTASSPPDLGVAPSGIDSPFHVGISLSDDFANEAMYALWRGGLLCFSLAPDNDTFPLDTSILNLLSGQAFTDLFPESMPMSLNTVPRAAPTVDYTGTHDIDVQVHDLDLEMNAELDGRMARMLAVTLNGPIGADLNLDGTTGSLAIALAINPDDLDPTVTYNEMHADANAAIEGSFGSSLSSILDTVLGSLLESLAFTLPSFSGLGIQDLQTSAAGTNEDWLGAYAWVGAVTYGSDSGCGGCGGDTGTDTGASSSSSCGGGCSTGQIPAAWTLVVPFGLLLGLRRRD